ncbi:MAG: YiiD C-terminal domain-containing protein [Moraxellaceae bacterium]|nr:YiiD C-terminal domain-containing protein [Moraxellaceae bacterium]HQX89337.1 YiiD C-terminal domain-containing protein [Moraxellaceae bacterium]
MSTPVKRAQALIVQLHQEVPLTAAMQLALQSFDDSTLVFRVPLLPNINDKGTGFAGSITSLGCITGWSLLTLWSEPLFGHCQCAVYDAQFHFSQPLKGDFTATVTLPDMTHLMDSLRRKRKGKVSLDIEFADSHGVAARLHGRYAVWQV